MFVSICFLFRRKKKRKSRRKRQLSEERGSRTANNEMKRNQAKEKTRAKKTTTRAKKNTDTSRRSRTRRSVHKSKKANVNCGVPIIYVDVRFVVFFPMAVCCFNLRTHAFENTSAWNWRLRPLGQVDAADAKFDLCKLLIVKK